MHKIPRWVSGVAQSCFRDNGGEVPGEPEPYGFPFGTEGKVVGFFSLSRFLLAISVFLIRSRRCW